MALPLHDLPHGDRIYALTVRRWRETVYDVVVSYVVKAMMTRLLRHLMVYELRNRRTGRGARAHIST